MKRPLKIILLVFGGPAVGVALLVGGFYLMTVSTVMVKANPDGRHKAKLTRVKGIDVNFKVYVDGRRV